LDIYNNNNPIYKAPEALASEALHYFGHKVIFYNEVGYFTLILKIFSKW